MAVWLSITLLLLNLANSVFHGTGIYLLLSLFPRARYKIQQLYLIHLSSSEFIFNTLEVIKISFRFVQLNVRVKVDEVMNILL